jgi:hypothetical protein
MSAKQLRDCVATLRSFRAHKLLAVITITAPPNTDPDCISDGVLEMLDALAAVAGEVGV